MIKGIIFDLDNCGIDFWFWYEISGRNFNNYFRFSINFYANGQKTFFAIFGDDSFRDFFLNH